MKANRRTVDLEAATAPSPGFAAALSDSNETGPAAPPKTVVRARRLIGLALVALGLMGIGAVVTFVAVRDSSLPTASESNEMADLNGLDLDQAMLALAGLGIAEEGVTVVEQESTQPSGFVVSQTPAPGSSLSSSVVLVVSVTVPVMPDVGGLAENDALGALNDAGIDGDAISVAKAPAAGPVGVVLAQTPRAGTRNPEDVSLLISEPAVSPDVTGLPGPQAVDVLEALGASVEEEFGFDPSMEPTVVLDQSVEAGAPLPDEIRIVVNAAPGLLPLIETERVDSSNCSGRDEAVDGDTYPKSVRCQARSDRSEAYIEFNLSRDFVVLQMVVGISDFEDESTAVADFTVIGDGRSLGTWRASFGEPVVVELDVREVLRLRLVARAVAPESSTLDMVFAGPALGGDPAILASYE